MKRIDSLLNKITMYRLTLYYLIGLVVVAFGLSLFHMLSYNPVDMLISTCIAVVVCFAANYVFSKFFHAATNIESVFITALILVLIIPVKFPLHATFFILASGLAMGSKYLLTVEKRHLFNPAAAAVAGMSFFSAEHSATWWIGTPAMLPWVLIGGLFLVRKTQREHLVLIFLVVYFLVLGMASLIYSSSLSAIFSMWQRSSLESAVFFFTCVMLIEPLTSPSTEKLQGWYAAIVAVLYATPQLKLFSFVLTPELALCIGNVYSYIVSPKYRLVLPLKEKIQLSPDTYVFLFEREKKFTFIPGQYMEWTLMHPQTDRRGNRRYFSIASSPSETDIMMEVKFYDPSSSYKKALLSLQPGQKIIAAQLAGDFVLPEKSDTPLVFIAGGVGIAPFRSMIQYIIDANLPVNISIIYVNRHIEDITFADTFEQARENGVNTIYVLTDTDAIPENWQGKAGYVDEQIIKEIVPDFVTRTFYLSGPQLMMQSFETILHSIGISGKNIKIDFFPGYEETI